MQIYRVNREGTDRITFHGTRAEAHAEAKERAGNYPAGDIYIDLIEVGVDKASVLAYLNQDDLDFDVISSWKLTSRGGLKLQEE